MMLRRRFLDALALLIVVFALGELTGLRAALQNVFRHQIRIDDYAPCFYTATASASTPVANTGILHGLSAAAQKTLRIPGGCKLLIRSECQIQGTCAADQISFTIPTGTRIECEDGAGFYLARRSCSGGRYPGAYCTADSTCQGGGRCLYDGGLTASYANDQPSLTHTLFKAATNSADIVIENCSIWTNQADPYQRCAGGTASGKPCKLECGPGGTNLFAGERCNVDADCPGAHSSGTCINGNAGGDCPASTCDSVPLTPVGLGKVVPIDLSAALRGGVVRNVQIYDHFNGANSIKMGDYALVENSNTARIVGDCNTHASINPAVGLGTACYGAISANVGTNTQPTVAVTNGISVGVDSVVSRSVSRGSTTAVTGAMNAQIDAAVVWPIVANGPGTASCGFRVGANGQIHKSRAVNLGAGCIGINLNGDYAVGDGNLIDSAGGFAYTTGLLMTGAHIRATNNTVKNLLTTGVGIDVQASQSDITNNAVNVTALNNQVCINLDGNNNQILSNTCRLPGGNQTPTNHQIHIVNDPGGTQQKILGNTFLGGWRGITQGTSGSGALSNMQIVSNRFFGMVGAGIVTAGAGVEVAFNYFNAAGTTSMKTLYCDASCSTSRGIQCNQDSDCTGTCNAGINKCRPEPGVGFVGNPLSSSGGTQHNGWVGNLVYHPLAAKQCMNGAQTATHPGALCETAGNTCSGGATCSGGPPATCQGGSEAGKACCASSGTAMCGVRDPVPLILIPDFGSASTHGDLVFSSNHVLLRSDHVGIDIAPGAGRNVTISSGEIVGNEISGGGLANTTGVRFPSAGITASNFNINGNNFAGLATDIANPKGTYGDISFPAKSISLQADQTTASTSFVDVNDLSVALDANRSYSFRCEFQHTAAATTTGIAFAMTGPSAPRSFTYVTEIPCGDSTAPCRAAATTRGIAVWSVQMGIGDDGTPTASAATGSTTTPSFARIDGNIVTGSDAGNLKARVKAEVNANVTVKKGSNCLAVQLP